MKLSEDFNGEKCVYRGRLIFPFQPFSHQNPHNTHTHSLSPGMFVIRDEMDYVVSEDFMKAVRKVSQLDCVAHERCDSDT